MNQSLATPACLPACLPNRYYATIKQMKRNICLNLLSSFLALGQGLTDDHCQGLAAH